MNPFQRYTDTLLLIRSLFAYKTCVMRCTSKKKYFCVSGGNCRFLKGEITLIEHMYPFQRSTDTCYLFVSYSFLIRMVYVAPWNKSIIDCFHVSGGNYVFSVVKKKLY